MKEELLPLVTPGKILSEEFLKPLGISGYRLSKDTGIPASRITEIIHGRRAITADTTPRLGLYFDMEPQFWLNLQAQYDRDKVGREWGRPNIPHCPELAGA